MSGSTASAPRSAIASTARRRTIPSSLIVSDERLYGAVVLETDSGGFKFIQGRAEVALLKPEHPHEVIVAERFGAGGGGFVRDTDAGTLYGEIFGGCLSLRGSRLCWGFELFQVFPGPFDLDLAGEEGIGRLLRFGLNAGWGVCRGLGFFFFVLALFLTPFQPAL